VSQPLTLGTLYQHLRGELAAAKIEEPDLEARMLLAFAAGIDQTRIIGYPEDEMDADIVQRVEALIARRQQGEPIAYIIGSREFWSLDFKVTPDTLIPRPDSETLIEAVLEAVPNKTAELKLLDLGTGSGCLLLALLSELPNASGTGIDINPKACAIAAENAENLNLTARATFIQSDWMVGIEGKFDIIVSNPPYIVESDIPTLEADVSLFEPHLALSGGPDGLDAYRLIADQAAAHLSPQGLLAVEIGMGQVTDIKELFEQNGFKIKNIHKDFSHIERCILATIEDS
jgi:release factor glutamine methyltransferase